MILWGLLLLTTLAAQAQPLIIISIDGLRPDYVLNSTLNVPNLKSFLAQGCYATGVRPVTPSLTYPCHATLVTGVPPSRHGILNNKTFDPLRQNQKGWYWYASDLRVPTLWDAARQAGLTTLAVHWPITVGAPLTWNIPQFWRAGTPDDRKLLGALSTPGLLDDAYPDGIDESLEADLRRAQTDLQLYDRLHPDVSFFYFAALDHEQHRTGPFSPESVATLERLDQALGPLLKPGAFVCVLSDHGFSRTDHALNLSLAFRQAGLLTVDDREHILDWKAAVWDAGGSATIVTRPGFEGAVRDLLDRLAADPRHGIESVQGDRVFMQPNFYVHTRLTGPLVIAAEDLGMHGHSSGEDAAFFLRGPGVPQGRSLGPVDMTRIAATLAGLLQLSLPEAAPALAL